MKIIDKTCVNSKWVADFLADEHQECCECFGACKVRVQAESNYIFILTKEEIDLAREKNL